MLNQCQRFLIGDQKGKLKIFNTNDGTLCNELISHQNQIKFFRVDFVNSLYLSASLDSTIKVQKENVKNKGSELRRIIKNVHNHKEINILEFSQYHNLLATTPTDSDLIYLYDYEYMKLIGCI